MGTWNLGTIRTKVRAITGRRSTNQISDSEVDDYINNYYQNVMPVQINSEALKGFDLTGNTVAGTGEYSLGTGIVSIEKPLLIDNDEIPLWYDKVTFFEKFPESETTQAKPYHGLLYERKLYLRPIPDAVYAYKAPALSLPTAFSADADEPDDQLYGPLIANGAAVEIHLDNGETEEATSKIAVMESYANMVFRKDVMSQTSRRSVPSF